MDAKLVIEKAKTSDLAPYAGNAKKHGEADVSAIAASIEQFGFNDPIGIWHDEDGTPVIVEGHGRLLAAKKLGMEEVPVIALDHLDDDARRAYVHVHNQTTLNTGFDIDVLNAEMASLPDFEWEAFGFEPPRPDIAQSLEDVVEDEPPENARNRVKRGEVWRCGEHRVMCGDSASPEDLDKLLGGERPKFVFTDPPYGVTIGDKNNMLNAHPGRNGNRGNGRIERNILGDTLSTDELYGLLVKCFTNLRELCDEACSYYVSSPQGGELYMMMMMMRDAGLPVRHNLIWVKNAACFSMGRLDYDYRHEPIFYTWTKSHNFYGGYGNTVIDDTMPIDKMSKAELKDLVRALRDDNDTSVIYCDKPLKCDLHPTMKPVKLVARFMFNSSAEGDVCADIFGGSGTTMIAAEQLGRKARLMELDPHYCAVILARWEKFTGGQAKLITG